MDDFLELNCRIAEYWLGRLDAEQEACLGYVSVCLAQLDHSATELAEVLASSKDNPLRVASLNREYLLFVRLAAKDVAAGKPEMLIRLRINLEQAELLGNLSDEEIDRLAFGWKGPIIQFASQAFKRTEALHEGAAIHHAATLLTTPLP